MRSLIVYRFYPTHCSRVYFFSLSQSLIFYGCARQIIHRTQQCSVQELSSSARGSFELQPVFAV